MSNEWASTVAKRWNREPAHVKDAFDSPPLDVDAIFAVMTEASAPFRSGTRFRALPDVRFISDQGRIRAPGELLPGTEDSSISGYVDRVSKMLDSQGWLLSVDQPLFLDYSLWHQVRQLVLPLWQIVGYPVAPVSAALQLGERHSHKTPHSDVVHHACVMVIIEGQLALTVSQDRDGSPPTRFALGRGDVMYLPAGCASEARYSDNCVALRILVPVDSRIAAQMLIQRGVEAVDDQRDELVPYIDMAKAGSHGEFNGDVGTFNDTATQFVQQLRSESMARVNSIMWTRQLSAAGLEPVPQSREPANLTAAHRILLCAPVVRVAQSDGDVIWAANGHAFSITGDAADVALQRLQQRRPMSVAEVCDSGNEPPAPGLLTLLNKLHSIRAIEVLTSDGDANV